MSAKETLKTALGTVVPKPVLDGNAEVMKFYKQYKRISDITEKIDIAMGRKKIYKYSFGSTKNFKIDPHAIPPTIQSYKV